MHKDLAKSYLYYLIPRKSARQEPKTSVGLRDSSNLSHPSAGEKPVRSQMQKGEALTFPLALPAPSPSPPYHPAGSHFEKTGVSSTAPASFPNDGRIESLCLPKAHPIASLRVVQDFIMQIVFPLLSLFHTQSAHHLDMATPPEASSPLSYLLLSLMPLSKCEEPHNAVMILLLP